MQQLDLYPSQRIGIGGESQVHLYAMVTSFTDGRLRGWVINGNWAFTLDTTNGKMIVETPFGAHQQSGHQVLYAGPFPKGIGSDYNTAIEFMNDQVALHKMHLVRSWITLKWQWVTCRFSRAARWARGTTSAILTLGPVWKAHQAQHLKATYVKPADVLDDEDTITF